MSQRHDAQLHAHLYSALGALLYDIADEECHESLGLIVLDYLDCVCGLLSLAEHYCNTGDVAGDQRNAERADDRIRYEADARVGGIGIAALDIFQSLDDLCSDSRGKSCIECLSQILLIGDKALEHVHACGQISQRLDLYARSRINCREVVGSIGKCYLLVSAVLGDCVVDCTLCQACDCIGTAIDQIS